MRKMCYAIQCDRLRKNATGERLWREMLERRRRIDTGRFGRHCRLSGLLEEGESLPGFLADDPTAGCYRSFLGKRECCFLRARGFEFIFLLLGARPRGV